MAGFKSAVVMGAGIAVGFMIVGLATGMVFGKR